PEIRRITSSLSPTGTVSDSMSVTKPARYSRAAMSCAVIDSELMRGRSSNSESIESVRKSQGSRGRTFPPTNRLRATSYRAHEDHAPTVQNIDLVDHAGRGPRRGGGKR